MEELQTTEVLDREILEDARRKAYRILKAADETIRVNAAEWERKTVEALEALEKKYEREQKHAAAEIMARLPVDKRRVRAEKTENLLRAAVRDWYAGLERGRVLSILQAGLSRRAAECGEFAAGGQCRALIDKLSSGEAEAILRAVLPGGTWTVTEKPSGGLYPGIILENSAVRITASIDSTVDFFLSEKRVELAAALMGEAVLDENVIAGGTA